MKMNVTCTGTVLMVLALSVPSIYGFAITFAECNSTTAIKPGQKMGIQSPGFPEYVKNRCQYEVNCNPMESTFLALRCPKFELEPKDTTTNNCKLDFLQIEAKNYPSTRFCGEDNPAGLATETGYAKLIFKADPQNNFQGFRCYLWCVARPTARYTVTQRLNKRPTTLSVVT